VCRALPSPLMSPTLPLDTLGGLAKANIRVAAPGGQNPSTPPSTCSGAWLKPNLGAIRPEDIVPNEYLPFVTASLLGHYGC
jgi:hypothetical protein